MEIKRKHFNIIPFFLGVFFMSCVFAQETCKVMLSAISASMKDPVKRERPMKMIIIWVYLKKVFLTERDYIDGIGVIFMRAAGIEEKWMFRIRKYLSKMVRLIV
jgi:hypothetical protein